MAEDLHVCGYDRCGKSFATPVRLTDLSHKPRSETYYACPYCFSKMEESCPHVDSELKMMKDGGYEISTKGMKTGAHKDSGKDALAANCPHHVGYLKTRSKDEAVPDSCLTCSKILQCMV